MQPRPRASRLVLVAGVAAAMAPSPGVASCEDGTPAGHFFLRTNDFLNECTLPFWRLAPASVTVYIDVYAVPFQIARFSLPEPPIGYFVQETWFYPHTGDRVNGIEIDLGSCSTNQTVTLGYLTYYVFQETANCVPWRVNDGAEIEDCANVTRACQEWPYQVTTTQQGCHCGCIECSPSLPPHSLYPPHGATNVPINVELSWVLPFDPATAQEPHCAVRISTDPTCETGQTFSVDCAEQNFSPDFLVPGTTYYWQATAFFPWYYGQSPIFSFTTEDAVSAMPTTWGRVKVMYSD